MLYIYNFMMPLMSPRRPIWGHFRPQEGSKNGQKSMSRLTRPLWFLAFFSEGPGRPILDRFWTLLGPLLGPSWAHLGAILGPSWTISGPSWSHLAPSWGHFAPRWSQVSRRWHYVAFHRVSNFIKITRSKSVKDLLQDLLRLIFARFAPLIFVKFAPPVFDRFAPSNLCKICSILQRLEGANLAQTFLCKICSSGLCRICSSGLSQICSV